MASPDFGRSVNPITARGTDYAHLITNGTPGFSELPTALIDQHSLHESLNHSEQGYVKDESLGN